MSHSSGYNVPVSYPHHKTLKPHRPGNETRDKTIIIFTVAVAIQAAVSGAELYLLMYFDEFYMNK